MSDTKTISKTVKRMRAPAKRVAQPAAGLKQVSAGAIRNAIMQQMRRMKWSTYQLWKASDVPRTIVYTFIGKDDGRDINLRHAEAMLRAVGISMALPDVIGKK